MTEKKDLLQAAKFFKTRDDFWILTHQNPDGDTLGCAFALYYTLTAHGKRVRVVNEKPLPQKYAFLFEGYRETAFEPKTIVAVDIASPSLFGNGLEKLSSRVDLCIDHHKSNTGYATMTVLNSAVSAACEIIYELILAMDGEISDAALLCVYTGVSTDCGCFKYSNTTAQAHEIAALALHRQLDIYRVNHAMFESKSRAQLEIERAALQKLTFYYQGRCALVAVTQSELVRAGATESDLDVLPAMTRQIQGVEVGVVIKEREPGEFKISLRTGKRPDASAICSEFGGGGHVGAAGCTLYGKLEDVTEKIVAAVGRYI